LLLLDEPDSHIHPDKQKALLRVICDWAEENDAKVLIATHSRHLLETLDGDATFHWMQNGARQDESDFDRVKVLMDLGALDRADLLKNGEIDAVVLTEDANAADASRKRRKNPLRHLLKANGIDLDRVQVWSYEGCTHHHTAKVLSRFIRDTAPGVEILVHRDRDYFSDAEVQEFVDRHGESGLDVFVTDGADVESHFLDEDHLSEVADLGFEEIEALLEEATDETREDSLDAFSRAEMEREKEARRAAGKTGEPSPSRVAKACEAQLDNDPGKFRHGKKTLKALRRLIQEHHGTQPDLLAPSEHLAVQELEDFADRLGHTEEDETDD
jgi:predicted ATP-dependent endonuclease of OLD family